MSQTEYWALCSDFNILDDQYIRKDDYADHPCDYPGDEISAFTHGICIGDSLTSGTMNYNDNGTKYISYDKYSFPRCLERLTGISIENKGRGGNSSAEWYEAMKDVDLSGYDFCIMQLGVNDAIRYSGWTQTSIDGFNNIISKLKQENPHIKIFVANIIPATSYSAANHLAVSEGIKGLTMKGQSVCQTKSLGSTTTSKVSSLCGLSTKSVAGSRN